MSGCEIDVGGGGNIYIICIYELHHFRPSRLGFKASEKLCMRLVSHHSAGISYHSHHSAGISYGFRYSFTSIYGASNITPLRISITLPRSKCCSTTLHGISLAPLTMRKLEKEKREEGLVNGHTTSCSSAGMLAELHVIKT